MAEGPRSFTADELAGIVDLFDALTVDELVQGCDELSFLETGETPAEETLENLIDEAVATFHLAPVPEHDDRLLVAGPAAFPVLPDGADNLTHILDVPERSVDREAVAAGILDTIEAELEAGAEEGRRHELVALTYELDGWGDVDAAAVRERADAE